jgi:hypothetical protein
MLILLAHLALLVPAAEAPAELALSLDNLNGAWRFATDPRAVGEADGWALPEFDDAGWRTLRAPGFWEPQGVTEPRPGQAPQPAHPQMRYTDYDGVAWYRRRVTVPAAWAGKPLVLRLGQVDDQDRSFINGRLVGATGPGIERAVLQIRRYDVPPELVRYGEVNTVAVRVTDLGGPGGLQGPMLSLLPADFGGQMLRLPAEDRSAAERFAAPPGSARILRIHHDWPANPEAARMTVLGDLARGFGGVATNVPFTGYLEDPAAWERLEPAIATVREADGALWLYDEEGYPSGAAGGIVLRDHPEYEALGLLCVDGVTSGQPLELTAPPGTIRAALAVPVGPDGLILDRAVRLDARAGQPVRFEPPQPGAWHVMIVGEDALYEGTHATSNVFRDRRAPNLLLAEATDYFLQVTHDRYAARYGKDLGRIFVSTFTDEPSLMAYFMRPMPYRPLPWSATLAADYEARWGEPLLPQLPLLYADGPGAALARHRFWKLIGEQVSANYFGRIRQWCDAHGLRSGGHLLAEESLLGHVPFYGDFMACARELTAPSIDVLTSLPPQVPIHGGKLVASAGELCGNTVTMSEASDHSQRYRREGDTRPIVQVTIDDIRGSLHRQQLSGINTFTSYYRFEPFAGTDLVQLNTEIGRINTVLRGGHLVADIAVLYPIESVWAHYRPRVHGATDAPGAVAIDQAFTMTHRALFETGRDYCFVDTRGLLESKVVGDRLIHGELAWKVVILPGVETLPQQAWEILDAFQRAGGVLIAVGPRPKNTDTSFPSPAVQALDRDWFGEQGRGLALPAGQEALLPAVLDNILERDLSWSPDGALKVTHRRVEEHDVWLVINDSPEPYHGTLTVCGDGRGELWEPASGAIRPVVGAEATVEIGGYGAVILRYPQARQRLRQAGGVPSLPEPRPVLFGAPTVGHGQHVDGSLAQSPSDGQAVWTATGVLTKSHVDTHLFVRFPLPAPTDLTDSRWLVLDTWTSDEQKSGPSLLVLAGDADGGTFLAEAGRSLGQSGHLRAYVPWNRFRPLGAQPETSNGVLDVDRITHVSLGWGGHFGQQGDRIAFDCVAPQVAE